MRRRKDETTINEGGALAMPLDRRQFLVAGGVTGAAVAAFAAISASPAGAATKGAVTRAATSAMPSAASSGSGDLDIAAFAAGLEVLAVGTYKAALDAALAGKLGPVPPAGATYVQTAMAQHQAQLDKWNSVLTGAGKPAVTEPDAKLKPVVDQKFAAVKDFGGAAMLARDLEGIAAATYLSAIPSLESPDAVELAGSIQIIDMQHVAILNYVLGEYPVPDTFASTKGAATP